MGDKMNFKKTFIWLIISLVIMPFSLAVKINEVYYDPIGTESGGEVIELFNDGPVEVDISSWVIATPTSAKDATIPDGTLLAPGSYFLIADVGFSTSKDDASWPNANYEEAITLKNSDGGVALLDNLGNRIDAVGWGNAANIDSQFYEGTPAEKTASGESLQRIQDTNDNSLDFSRATPNLQSNGGSGGFSVANASNSFLTFTVMVEESIPEILNVNIVDEDDINSGIQIYPIPKMNKEVVVTVDIRASAGISSITSVKAVFF